MPTNEQLTQEVEESLKSQALSVIERSAVIKVVDQASYDEACSILLNQIKPMRQRWSAFWEGLREPAYRAYQAIMDKKNAGDKPLEQAERQIKAEIARYETEQQRIREQAQRKAQAEAEEAARIEAEKLAEFAAMEGRPEEEIAAIVPAPVVAAPVEPTYEKASGVSIREVWKCKVNDIKALCRGIAKGTVPASYVIPNQSALDARAKADKSTMKVDGCMAYPEKVVAGRLKF